MKKLLLLIAAIIIVQIAYSQDLNKSFALELVKKDAIVLGIEINNNEVPVISKAYTDAKRGVTYIYLQQTYYGINVHNVIKTLVYKKNILQYQSGNFISSISNKAGSRVPTIQAAIAINKVAEYLKLPMPNNLHEIENQFHVKNKFVFNTGGIAKGNINVELVWVKSKDEKKLLLAWNVNIDVINSTDYLNVRVNASNGEIVDEDNYTVYENENQKRDNNSSIIETNIEKTTYNYEKEDIFKVMSAPPPPPSITSAIYNVIPYPYENRFVGNIAQINNPWLNTTGFDTAATTYGWHFDGTNSYNYTRGNNVYAYDDSLNKNAPGRSPSSSTASPSLTFNFIPDFTQQPTTTINRRFATTNLFYWNNIMHDVFYQYGFDEASGNFQNDNLGRGGQDSDYVHAEAQDGSGTNNSNFYTPPDGTSGRMQMYLYNPAYDSLTITAPSTISGKYYFKEGNISKNNKLYNKGKISGQLVYYNDDATSVNHYACSTAYNNISGKIAFITSYSGSCNASYSTKVKNAQNAGAIAVVVFRGSLNGIATVMGGNDTTINIPAIMVSNADGTTFSKKLDSNIVVNISFQDTIHFDGALDNGIISHEYTHGISNRLTGGGPTSTSNPFSNYEQGGEGWSDYISLMMTTNWSNAKLTDDTISRTHASYATNQLPSGIGARTYPYTTNMSLNPHTYNDISDTTKHPQYNSAGSTKIPNATEVHYIGEVWCSALWDMTWNIIKQNGYINPNLYDANGGGGNIAALNLVIQGMKLQPFNPGFLDARDAILAADSLMYGGYYHCAIWSAFARRGMGFSAKQGSSNNTVDQTVAFDAPERIAEISGLYEGCLGSSVQLKDSTSGGVWSISNSNAVTDNTGKLTMLKYGMDTVYYSKANTCNKKVNYIVKIRSLPTVASISGSSMICIGNNTVLTDSTKNIYEGIYNIKGYTLRAGDNVKTGTIPKSSILLYTKNKNTVEFKDYHIWSDSSAIGIGFPVLSINTSTNAVTISSDTSFELNKLGSLVVNNSNYNSRYDSSTKTFYISYTWGAGITSRLVTDTISYLSPSTNGGIWSSSNSSVANISNIGLVNTLKAGKDTISYLYTDPFGCSDTVTKVMSVNALPVIPPINGVSSLCLNNATLFTDSSDVNKFEGYYRLYGGFTRSDQPTYTGVSSSPNGYFFPYFLKSSSYNSVDANVNNSTYGLMTTQYIYVNGSGYIDFTNVAPRFTIDNANNVRVSQGIAAVGTSVVFTQNATELANSKFYPTGITGVTKTLGKKTIVAHFRWTASSIDRITTDTFVCTNDTTYGFNWLSNNTNAKINSNGLVTGLANGWDTITYKVKNAYGCSNTATKAIYINPAATTNNINISGCNSVTYKSKVYYSSTIVRDTVKNIHGCDSIYNVGNITVNKINPTADTVYMSNCNSILYHGVTYTSSAIVRDTVRSTSGCDSLYHVAAIKIVSLNVSGRLYRPTGVVINYLQPATAMLTGVNAQNILSNSAFNFGCLNTNSSGTIKVGKNNDVNKANGVTTLDIALVQSHILQKSLLNSPYKIIAADVNGDGKVTTLDIVYMKRLILGIDTSFTGNRLWSFVDSSYSFPVPTNPFPYKDSISYANLSVSKTNQSFIGCKLGDVNWDWNPAVARPGISNTVPVELSYDPIQLNNDRFIRIPIKVKNFKEMLGLQYTINFNAAALKWVGINNKALNFEVGTNHAAEGKISLLWVDAKSEYKTLEDGTEVFELLFERTGKDATGNEAIVNTLSLDGSVTTVVSYDKDYQTHDVIMKRVENIQPLQPETWVVAPNPTKDGVIQVQMNLSNSKMIVFKLFDNTGRVLLTKQVEGMKGANHFILREGNIPEGNYYLKAVGVEGEEVKKILIQ